MRAGLLRHRIVIEERNETKSAQGGLTSSWTTAALRWAEIMPLAGDELVNAQQIESTISHRVRLYYLPFLTTKLRIRFGQRVFGIKNIRNIGERNSEHVCLCTEVE